MTTAQRQIADAMAGVLTAAGVAGGKVYRARTRAISSDSPHGVIVRLTRSLSLLASVMGGRTEWRTLIQVECYGRLVGGEPDDASDELVEQVFAVLATNSTLGNRAMDTEPMEGDTLSWDFDELDTSLACITAKFIVSHQTIGRTLTP
jgi:hypothetical protein